MPANLSTPRPPAPGRNLRRLIHYLLQYRVELLLILLIAYICISKGLTVRIAIHDPDVHLQSDDLQLTEAGVGGWFTSLTGLVASSVEERASIFTVPAAEDGDTFNSVSVSDDPAPHISNLTLVLSPDYGQRKGLATDIVRAKKQRVTNYIDRYAATARREMRDHGIPASITLAQALLESNAGDSKLAVNSGNHFGIKCRAKCLGCTCRNYGDDTRYDMFRVFETATESFEEHSTLLNSPRYAKLKAYGKDFRKWAHGLRSCGYATDQQYGSKLITIIENLGLDRYDI